MRHLFRIFIAVMILSLPAQAQENDIKKTITGQLTAFQSDDMEQAFSFASDQIRTLFGTPEYFGAMVKNGYPMVYRPKSFEFQELHNIEGHFYQQVQIEGYDDIFYVIQYAMIKSDIGWKIDGVELFKTNIIAL